MTVESMNIAIPITEEEKRVYNYGIKQAQWHVLKAMMDIKLSDKTKKILKQIYKEIQKELK